MSAMPASPISGLSLLFLKVDDLISPDPDVTDGAAQYPNGLDIIYAIEEVSGRGSIEGAQKIGKLYRIYIKNETAKDKLSVEGFTFNGVHVSFYSQNPFVIRDQSDTVKIIIGGVPLSVASDEFEKVLLDLDVQILSDLKFENYRDKDGSWTAYKTGRRFLYCKKPDRNLPAEVKIGLWRASLYYKGQVRPRSRGNTNVNNNIRVSDQSTFAKVVDTGTPADASVVPPDVSGVSQAVPVSNSAVSVHDGVSVARQSSDNEQPMDEESVKSSQCEEGIVNTSSKPEGKKSQVSQTSLPKYLARRSRSQSVDRYKRKGTNHSNAFLPPNKASKNYTMTSAITQHPDWFEQTEYNTIKNNNS